MDGDRPDRLDLQIIRLLRRDGRVPTKEIAGALDITEVTAASRIRILNEAGVMRVMAQRNVSTLRERRLCILNIWVCGRSIEAVARDLAELVSVTTVHICVGSPEIHVMSFFEAHDDVLALIQNEIGCIPGIDRLEVDLALAIRAYRSDYAALNVAPAAGSTTEDPLDDRIIRQLQVDGRVSNREIARMLEVPPSTVRERVNRMLKSQQIRIGAVCDPAKLGLSLSGFAYLRVAAAELDAALRHLSAIEDLGLVASISGAYNIFVVFGARDFDHLVHIAKSRLEETPGLREIAVRSIAETKKHRADLISIVPT